MSRILEATLVAVALAAAPLQSRAAGDVQTLRSVRPDEIIVENRYASLVVGQSLVFNLRQSPRTMPGVGTGLAVRIFRIREKPSGTPRGDAWGSDVKCFFYTVSTRRLGADETQIDMGRFDEYYLTPGESGFEPGYFLVTFDTGPLDAEVVAINRDSAAAYFEGAVVVEVQPAAGYRADQVRDVSAYIRSKQAQLEQQRPKLELAECQKVTLVTGPQGSRARVAKLEPCPATLG